MAKYSSDVKQDRAYNQPEDSKSVNTVNPAWSRQTGATLLSLSSIAANTTAYAYIDMAGYRYFTLQGETLGTAPTDVLTVTIEATVQDDGTAAASCTYQDVTNSLFGVASWVDTYLMAICDTPQTFKYVRVKYTTSNTGGNDCDLTVHLKQNW